MVWYICFLLASNSKLQNQSMSTKSIFVEISMIFLNLRLHKVPLMKEITFKEVKKRLGKKDEAYLTKVHLLANGMIKVHGYTKEKAITMAKVAASDWFNNNGKYSIKA